jgi:retinol dehydrogenase-12/retinol dehydrogenase-13
MTPEEGARTTVHCVTTPALGAGYYRDCRPTEPSADARDAEVAARLWEHTAAWLR